MKKLLYVLSVLAIAAALLAFAGQASAKYADSDVTNPGHSDVWNPPFGLAKGHSDDTGDKLPPYGQAKGQTPYEVGQTVVCQNDDHLTGEKQAHGQADKREVVLTTEQADLLNTMPEGKKAAEAMVCALPVINPLPTDPAPTDEPTATEAPATNTGGTTDTAATEEPAAPGEPAATAEPAAGEPVAGAVLVPSAPSDNMTVDTSTGNVTSQGGGPANGLDKSPVCGPDDTGNIVTQWVKTVQLSKFLNKHPEFKSGKC